jgi:ABC-type oligopeptide transport system substrate-binding subunit
MTQLLRAIGFNHVSEEEAIDFDQVYGAIFTDKRVQMGGFEFIQDYPAPDTFLAGFTCDESDGFSNYCDPGLDALVREARALQTTDASAAAKKWAEVDREVTGLVLWCPLINEGSDVVSARVGNFQFNLSYGVLLDQVWVK